MDREIKSEDLILHKAGKLDAGSHSRKSADINS
jgi:hypothetical protein